MRAEWDIPGLKPNDYCTDAVVTIVVVMVSIVT